MTLQEVNSRFKYISDRGQYGRTEHWAELEEMDGELVGDCESYAMTLKNQVEEFKDYDYWFCRLNGGGHCILMNGSKVIDNNCKSVMSLDTYMSKYAVADLSKYTKLGVWYRITITKLLGFVPVIG